MKLILETKEKRFLVLLFVITFGLRLVQVAYVHSSDGTLNWNDDWEYSSMGKQIADGHWSPMIDDSRFMQVAPVLPMIIALFIKIFGNTNVPIFIYNCILTSLVVPVLLILGKNIFNRKVGLCLSVWGVFYMDFFKYNYHLLKEPTVFFLLPLTLLLIVKSIQTINYKYSILSSLSFALLIHTDERYLFYILFFLVAFFLNRSVDIYKALKSAAIWISFVFLLMVPWGIHNYKLFHQVVLISPRTTAFTSRLWGRNISGINFTSVSVTNYTNELEIYKSENNVIKYGIAPHEFKGSELYIRSFINFWQPAFLRATYIEYGARLVKWSWKHNLMSIFLYGIFIPLYILGLIYLIIDFNLIGLFLGIIPLLHSLLHTYMIWTMERYRSPIVFIIVMIGIYATVRICSKIKDKFHLEGDK